MTSRLRPYLTYFVLLAIGALISVGGLTWAHYNDQADNITPAVAYCATADYYQFPMPSYCYDLR